MAYIQYYYQPADTALSASEILRRTGVDPTTYGSAGLTQLGIYPITLVANPYDTNLYNVVLSYTINGTNADQTWTATAKPLATAQTAGDTQVKQSFSAYCNTLFTGDIANNGLIAIASVAAALRGDEYDGPFVAAGNAAAVLQTQMVNIGAATTVDEINDIVNPPAAGITGTIRAARTGNTFIDPAWQVGPTGATPEQITLVTPLLTIAYDTPNNEYPTTANAWGGSPYTFDVVFGGYVIGSFTQTNAASMDHVVNWTPPIPPA